MSTMKQSKMHHLPVKRNHRMWHGKSARVKVCTYWRNRDFLLCKDPAQIFWQSSPLKTARLPWNHKWMWSIWEVDISQMFSECWDTQRTATPEHRVSWGVEPIAKTKSMNKSNSINKSNSFQGIEQRNCQEPLNISRACLLKYRQKFALGQRNKLSKVFLGSDALCKQAQLTVE